MVRETAEPGMLIVRQRTFKKKADNILTTNVHSYNIEEQETKSALIN